MSRSDLVCFRARLQPCRKAAASCSSFLAVVTIAALNLILDKVILFAAHVLEVMFFTGVIGCALTILVSWVEILSDAFEDE